MHHMLSGVRYQTVNKAMYYCSEHKESIEIDLPSGVVPGDVNNLPREKERHSLSHLHGLFPRHPVIPLGSLHPRDLVIYVLHLLIDILLCGEQNTGVLEKALRQLKA